MEKIKNRDFRYYCASQVLLSVSIVALIVFALLSMIPVINIVMGFVYVVCSIAAGLATVFFSIYKIYFYYQLSLDVDAVCYGDGVESKSYLFVLALNTVTFGIYGKYWVYKLAQRLQANAPRYGYKMIVGGKDILVLDLFSNGMISAWEFVRNMNKIAKEYNKSGAPEYVGGAV